MIKRITYLLTLLAAVSASGALQQVPSTQISFPTNTYEVIGPTTDTAFQALVELDTALGASGDTAAANALDIVTNAAAIAANSVTGAAHTVSIATNTADIATVSNKVALAGTVYGMYKTSNFSSGAASTDHILTSWDGTPTGISNSGIALPAGTFTPPQDGDYLISAGVVFKEDNAAPKDWKSWISKGGSRSIPTGTAIHISDEGGYHGGSAAGVYALTTSDTIEVTVNHATVVLGGSVYVESAIFYAVYLGE
jgi:hypothetical protein